MTESRTEKNTPHETKGVPRCVLRRRWCTLFFVLQLMREINLKIEKFLIYTSRLEGIVMPCVNDLNNEVQVNYELIAN